MRRIDSFESYKRPTRQLGLAVLMCIMFSVIGCEYKDVTPEGELEIQESSDFLVVNVNGELLETEVGASMTNPGVIVITGLNSTTNEGVSLLIRDDMLGENRYELTDNMFNSRFARYVSNGSNSSCDYNRWVDQTVSYSGFLKIEELNQADRKIVGRFAFTVESQDCPQVTLEEGRFLVHY